MALLHRVAIRILAAYLAETTWGDVSACEGGGQVDIVGVGRAAARRIKVKSDPYCGSCSELAADRNYPFYRRASGTLALEVLKDPASKTPGWALAGTASELWYYRIAIASPLDEVDALLRERDEVFFSELPVAQDSLLIVPTAPLRDWLSANLQMYPARPVAAPEGSSWHRLVPEEDVIANVRGTVLVGEIFSRVSR